MASKKSIAAAAAAEDAMVSESYAAPEFTPVSEPAPEFTPVSEPAPAAAVAAEAPVVAAPTLALAPQEFAKAFEAPVKSISEMQEKVRQAIERTLSESRANYAKVKSAADETNTALEASFASAKSGVAEINAKLLESLRATADANFEFVKSAFAVKTIADYVALNGEFARKQIESMTSQTKAFSELARKVATDTVEPIKTQVTKTFKVAA